MPILLCTDCDATACAHAARQLEELRALGGRQFALDVPGLCSELLQKVDRDDLTADDLVELVDRALEIPHHRAAPELAVLEGGESATGLAT